MRAFFIILGKIILKFLITLGLFYLGWNLCLVNIFPNIQVLNFGQLCLLVLAKSLFFTDVNVNIDKK